MFTLDKQNNLKYSCSCIKKAVKPPDLTSFGVVFIKVKNKLLKTA